jgi:hypothetical protein
MNRAKICAALQDWPEDKQGSNGNLFDGICYCALGWLGHKIGIPDDDMLPGARRLGIAYKQIEEEYDMDVDEAEDIWNRNDSYNKHDYDSPKEAVLDLVGCAT